MLLLKLALVVAALIIMFLGAWLGRVLLPEDSQFQKYISNEALRKYMSYAVANPGLVAAWMLLLIFTVLTFVYS